MNYQGKKVAVLGMGRSGEAAAILLVCLGARVTILDSASEDALGAAKLEKLGGMGMEVVTGQRADQDAVAYDLAVLSPGIDPKTALVQSFLARGIPIIAEIELAYQNSSTPVIGITGTNGKTTTTELVAAMLTGAGVRTVAGGNIGKPYSEIVREGEPMDVITLGGEFVSVGANPEVPARHQRLAESVARPPGIVTRTRVSTDGQSCASLKTRPVKTGRW